MAWSPQQGARVCTDADDEAERIRRIPAESEAALDLVWKVMGWLPFQIAAVRRCSTTREVG